MLDLIAMGFHLGTLHGPWADKPGVQSFNPGVYAVAESPMGRVSFGVLRNSRSHLSIHVSRVWSLGPVDVSVGGITGYRRAPVLPMASISYAFDTGDIKPRIALIPGGAHLSIEREF